VEINTMKFYKQRISLQVTFSVGVTLVHYILIFSPKKFDSILYFLRRSVWIIRVDLEFRAGIPDFAVFWRKFILHQVESKKSTNISIFYTTCIYLFITCVTNSITHAQQTYLPARLWLVNNYGQQVEKYLKLLICVVCLRDCQYFTIYSIVF
jgi:hypothetical protein